MNQEQFSMRFKGVLQECINIAMKKNHDYATGEDALANFREFGSFGVAVRLSDKMKRLINFAKGGQLQVKDESIKDTCMDIINYAAIYIIMKEEEKEEVPNLGTGCYDE